MSHLAGLCLCNQITQVVPHKRWTTQTQQQCIMRSKMGNIKTSLPVYKHHPRMLYLQELPPLPKPQIKRLYRLVEPKPCHHHPPASLHQKERHKHLPYKINHTGRQASVNWITIRNVNQPVLHQVGARRQRSQLLRLHPILDHLQDHQLVQEMTSHREI